MPISLSTTKNPYGDFIQYRFIHTKKFLIVRILAKVCGKSSTIKFLFRKSGAVKNDMKSSKVTESQAGRGALELV